MRIRNAMHTPRSNARRMQRSLPLRRRNANRRRAMLGSMGRANHIARIATLGFLQQPSNSLRFLVGDESAFVAHLPHGAATGREQSAPPWLRISEAKAILLQPTAGPLGRAAVAVLHQPRASLRINLASKAGRGSVCHRRRSSARGDPAHAAEPHVWLNILPLRSLSPD